MRSIFSEPFAPRCSALAMLARLRGEKYFADVHAAGKNDLTFFRGIAAKFGETFIGKSVNVRGVKL